MPSPPDINPGIRKVVKLLNDNGFTTCDSGDGRTHDYECDRDEAYVCITVVEHAYLDTECRRLMALMCKHGVEIQPIGPDGKPCIMGSYDPANDTAIIELMSVDDSMLGHLDD